MAPRGFGILSPANPFVELRHDGKVLGATFASDGNSLLTWSSDHTARVWDVATGKQRLALREDAGLAGAAFTPDQGAVLTWSTDGSIRLWDQGERHFAGGIQRPVAGSRRAAVRFERPTARLVRRREYPPVEFEGS